MAMVAYYATKTSRDFTIGFFHFLMNLSLRRNLRKIIITTFPTLIKFMKIQDMAELVQQNK
ncbi:hypothetical protein HNQ03_003253 [Chryseobacterium sp. 16F]|uniref:Uncharacterized protein n=1 Tax=Frigoriflavimonas asaccharolytica TaxID=2735899 RepID=A0A8J8GAQ6_9FLAO|nr:hypothetical protein [Frigoriflavimonas asaccharolytica]